MTKDAPFKQAPMSSSSILMVRICASTPMASAIAWDWPSLRRPEIYWCSVNERDGLGDNLVPDYITHLQEGGYYGWPWCYMGGRQDPRHEGKHPELKDKVITPDVILQPHNASLELTFYDGTQFPDQYRGDIFAAEHGSWNRSTRVGYELIRVPLHGNEQTGGDYEDFMTGFVVDNEHVWGGRWASPLLIMAPYR